MADGPLSPLLRNAKAAPLYPNTSVGTRSRDPVEVLADMLQGPLTALGLNSGDPYAKYQRAKGLAETIDPGVQALVDAGRQTAAGQQTGSIGQQAVGAGTGALAMAGLVPGAGKGRKAVKTAIDAAAEATAKVKAPWWDKVLETKMPQVAERYPIEGYPALGSDPKKVNAAVFPEAPSRAGLAPKLYPEKALSPEGEQVQKMREAAQAKIDAGEWTPYFDPKKRFDVNPKNYPDYKESTLTQVPPGTSAPSRKALADKTAMANDPAALQRLDAAYKDGLLQKEDAGNWYFMGQLEKKFTDRFGAKEGRKRFQNQFAEAMAATTGGADPNSNWMMAQYGNYQKAHGLPIPEEAYNYPFPVGGRYAAGNMAQYRKILMGSASEPATGINRMTNAKRYNFAGDFLGHDMPTMDEQELAGMFPTGAPGGKPLQSVPSEHYGIYQQPLVDYANKLGIKPKAVQDVSWAGFKNQKMKADAAAKEAKKVAKGGTPGIGHNNPPPDILYKAKPMISQINESIERTHLITGMPREEIVQRGLLEGKIPMYALPLAGMGAAGLYGMGQRKPQKPGEQVY